VPELDALLDRIGLTEAPPPTLDGLRTLHRAYVSGIPYEDLSVQLGEHEPLDVDRIAARLLCGRGGYCFELNGVLAWMLEALGFAVERHQAIVGTDRRPTLDDPINHLALVVDVDGEPWLADAGLGEGPLDPLPLRPGRHHVPADSPLWWEVEAEPDGGWFITQHPWGSLFGFRMLAPVVELPAFDPSHLRLSTSPESSFVGTLVLQRAHDDRIVTLRALTLSEAGPDADRAERRVLADADAFAAVLRDPFGIDVDALGPERMARLWELASAQHADYVARAAD
jgi:N-hydroxyarylamine O-acetyltransferase